ncbi:ABC transporter permease [Rhizobium sp. TRM95111]|uniref:FtsX-like permease family protein n=1 Tax=Rhizobium alarense TaxID=2846851 RepID=UPI001F2E9545|nr:ABC transporter permease [Rhizobium alarense]MCF3642399.1 ABC transporter permease [Rhizobium alarense]
MIGFVLADLRRLWLGAAVVVLLIAFATALGVAVTLQERALRLGSARAADRFDVVVGAPGSETQLVLSSIFLQASPLPLMPGDTLARLAADPRVAWAAPVGFGDSLGDYPVVGTSTVLVDALGGLAEGIPFATLGEAVAGAAVDLPVGYAVKPTHGLAGLGGQTHAELSYRIVGRLPPTGTAWDKAILVPVRAVWSIHGMEAGEAQEHQHENEEEHAAQAVSAHGEGDDHAVDPAAPIDELWDADLPGLPAVIVKPKTIADAYRLRQDYRGGDTLAVFPGEVLTGLYATLGDARAVLAAVAVGAELLVAAALLLVTVIHVGQRRRQIGALRAFGAPRLAVFGIVWSELVLLCGAGIGLGYALGYAAAQALSAVLAGESGVSLPVVFVSGDAVMALALLAGAGLFAAIPALLAYRESPAAALRA